MIRWAADPALNELLYRYYRGEAGLWDTILRHVDVELLRRQHPKSTYHIRFLWMSAGMYEVLVEDARGYEREG